MTDSGALIGPRTCSSVPSKVPGSGQLAIFGTRGMPAHRYPSLLSLIAEGRVDIAPLVTRRIGLSGVTTELAAFDGPAEPGVAVVDDFTA